MAVPLSFLRPLPAPRPSYVRCFLRRISSTSPKVPEASAEPASSPSSTTTFTPASPTSLNEQPAVPKPDVYQQAKRGGNLHQTVVRKITGNVASLKEDLKKSLDLDKDHIKINQLTQQIIIRGWKKHQVAKFLREQRF